MHLKLPKSNVEWIIADYPNERDVELQAEFCLPSGERLRNGARIQRYLLQDGCARRTVEALLQDLEREVGRRMVRG